MALFKVYHEQISLLRPCPANSSLENDRVVLTRLRSNHSESTSLLTPPLALPNTSIDLRADRIFHHDIIGKRLRDVVTSKKGHAYRITEPTLGEYTNLVPRLVTPVRLRFQISLQKLTALDIPPGRRPDCESPRPQPYTARLEGRQWRDVRDIRGRNRPWSLDDPLSPGNSRSESLCTRNPREESHTPRARFGGYGRCESQKSNRTEIRSMASNPPRRNPYVGHQSGILPPRTKGHQRLPQRDVLPQHRLSHRYHPRLHFSAPRGL